MTLALGLALAAILSSGAPALVASPDDYIGRWNVRLTDAADTFTGCWIDVRMSGDALESSLVWRWGSAVPATRTEVRDGKLFLYRGSESGKQDVFEVRLDGAVLTGEARYANGSTHRFEGRRAPDLAAKKAPQWAKPVTLFDGKTLDGWRLRDPKAKMGWAAVGGELAVVAPEGNADLVSEKTFQDMKLHIEFNVEPKGNSGIYLRGRYEIQILDDPAQSTAPHGCGALYSRIAPRLDATKPGGEWQTFDMTLIGRTLTVVLNGRTIIENAHVDGITGGAIDPFEDVPGPLMLQGDHGKVRFRNIVVTPAE